MKIIDSRCRFCNGTGHCLSCMETGLRNSAPNNLGNLLKAAQRAEEFFASIDMKDYHKEMGTLDVYEEEPIWIELKNAIRVFQEENTANEQAAS